MTAIPDSDIILNPFRAIIYSSSLSQREKEETIIYRLNNTGPAGLKEYLALKKHFGHTAAELLDIMEDGYRPIGASTTQLFGRAAGFESPAAAASLAPEFDAVAKKLAKLVQDVEKSQPEIGTLRDMFGFLATTELKSGIETLKPESVNSANTFAALSAAADRVPVFLKALNARLEDLETQKDLLLTARLAQEEEAARKVLNGVLDKGAVTVADTEAPTRARFKPKKPAF